jgi:hypothetical protein
VTSPFNEGILRHITALTKDQQLTLVQDLQKSGDKREYRKRAEDYRAENGLMAAAEQRLRRGNGCDAQHSLRW